MTNIVVIGAGITGVTTAYAMETSFANGGQLSASNAEVWNNWGTMAKGMRWMLRPDAPLLLNPMPTYHKYSWLAEFCGQIGNYRDNSIATARLAILARDHLFEIAEAESIDFDLERRGILHIYHDRESLEAAGRVNGMLREAGLDRYEVTPDEMLAIEPALRGPFHGGFFTPSDSTGDIYKFTRGLGRACMAKGVQFLFETDVTSIASISSGVTS
jgi:D-amino-acid dehydrogenase